MRHTEKIRQRLTFTSGVKELCKALSRFGCKTAVISGGFMPLADYVKQSLGLDYAFANNLHTDGQVLTGMLMAALLMAKGRVTCCWPLHRPNRFRSSR